MSSQLTFNYGHTLAICISARNNVLSVKQQLQKLALLDQPVLQRIKIILVDNDSTDGTPNAAKLFEGRVPFEYVSNTENLSQDNSFTFALNQAIPIHSKYIWMLDARNILRIEHLPSLLDLLDQNEAGLIHLASTKARKDSVAYVDVDDFIQTIGMGIIDVSRNIIRTDMIRGYNPRDFGAGTGIPAVPLLLHVALAGKQNFVYNPTLFDNAGINFVEEAVDPIRTYVKNLLSVYDRYEDSPHGISPYTTMKMKNKVSDFMFPYIFRLFVLRRRVKEADPKASRGIVKQNLGWRPSVSALKRCFSPRLWGKVLGAIWFVLKKIIMVIAAIVVIIVCNTAVKRAITGFRNSLATFRFRHRVKVGKHCSVESPFSILGGRYITVGEGFNSRRNLELNCINTGNYTPKLHVGDNVSFGRNVRVSVIRDVKIGNGVKVGDDVLITDYQYGKTDIEALHLPPADRPLTTRGPVAIGDNVLIGPQAVILAGVTIGKNAVIGAKAVVTHDVPPYSVAAGIPAVVRRK